MNDYWMISWICVVLTVFVLGNHYFMLSIKNLSKKGEAYYSTIILTPKVLVDRDNFSELGWRYRNRALITVLLVPLWILIRIVF
jgi:hypothetical protein